MVCPLCRGKSEVGVFCANCYLKKNLQVDVPSVIEITRCSKCDAYLVSGKWVSGLAEEDVLKRAAEGAIKTNMKKLEKAGILKFDIVPRQSEFDLTVVITLGDSEVTKRAIMRIKKVACQDCSRIAGGYYEAVLQLRGNVSQRDVDEIVKKIESHKDRFAFINKIMRMHGGFDIYVGSKKSAEKIVKEYRGKVETNKSSKLVGMDARKGKQKFRFNYLLRF